MISHSIAYSEIVSIIHDRTRHEFSGKKKSRLPLEGSGIDFIRKATTYSPAFAVPSALMGLTSLFG
ncbi:MAG: hypothetical protein ACFCUM_18325, partial [Bacteroidales bacterium]